MALSATAGWQKNREGEYWVFSTKKHLIRFLVRFGFVEMGSVRGAERAVRGLDGTQVWGKQVFPYLQTIDYFLSVSLNY